MDFASATGFASALSGSDVGWLALAFLLGLVHAFDADHVMALSVFASRGRGAVDGVRAGLRWSAGHGVVVVTTGLILIAAGRAMPAPVTAFVERTVGIVMIGLGLFVWLELVRRRPHLHFHIHDGLAPHAHWHGHPGAKQAELAHQHDHGALFVGALHGLAGAAPILVLLPLANHSPGWAVAYLVLFGLGVAFAMVGVSGAIGHVAGRLSGAYAGRGLSWLRAVGASGSMTVGAWLAFVR